MNSQEEDETSYGIEPLLHLKRRQDRPRKE